MERKLERFGGLVALVELGTAGVVAERLGAGAGKVFAGGMILGGPQGTRWLGADLPREATPEEKARLLARTIRQWGSVEVGAASVVEGVPESQPPTVAVGIAVSLDGREEGRAHTFGGDLPSIRIRTATLTLDLLRRTIPD